NCSHLCVLKPLNQYECLCPLNTTRQVNGRTCKAPTVDPPGNPVECNCLNGKCVYHVETNSGHQLAGCLCFRGYTGENCTLPQTPPPPPPPSKLWIVIIIVSVSLLLIGILAFSLIQLKRKGKLQSIPTPQLPRNIKTIMNKIRNFIIRSTDNINTVQFRNARSTTARDQITTKSPAVFPNPMYGAITTASNQPARLATSSDELAKLDIEVQPPPSKPSRKATPASPQSSDA
ncbi:unnamed protein product, partial [Rotaria sordida]